jgi:hypothetical protein
MVERPGTAGEESCPVTRVELQRDVELAQSIEPRETAILATGPEKT